MAAEVTGVAASVAMRCADTSCDEVVSHLQPIIDVATGSLHAMEALARFPTAPELSVTRVIAAAHAAGAGFAVERACLRSALARRRDLPPDVRLAVNVSPDVLVSAEVDALWDADLHGIIIEITEHRASDPAALLAALDRLRARGAAIAVDDLGIGHAGLLRLATLRPDIVKLDRSIVRGLRGNRAHRAVAEGLVAFSRGLGASVIGEGVEDLDDLVALAESGVDYAQGWAIGVPALRPGPISPVIVGVCRGLRLSR